MSEPSTLLGNVEEKSVSSKLTSRDVKEKIRSYYKFSSIIIFILSSLFLLTFFTIYALFIYSSQTISISNLTTLITLITIISILLFSGILIFLEIYLANRLRASFASTDTSSFEKALKEEGVIPTTITSVIFAGILTLLSIGSLVFYFINHFLKNRNIFSIVILSLLSFSALSMILIFILLIVFLKITYLKT